ncbi:MAG: GGDEF domain-containing protein [Sphingomonadaceae bacterium]
MDAYTLLVVSALAGLIMAASMALLHRAGSRAPCLLDWTAAGLCFLASNGVALLATRATLPYAIAPVLANLLYFGGHYLILGGLRRHLGLRPRYDWLLLLLAGVAVLHGLPYTQSSVLHRLLVLTPLLTGINASVLWLLWRLPQDEAKPSYLPLAVVEAGFMAWQVGRALFLALGDGAPLTVFGSEIPQTVGALVVLAFLSLGTMSCAMIVIRRQELALRNASLTDSLTGWLNRRALQDVAEREFQRSRRSGATFHFLTFDIDHFKSVNDQHGHAIGDAAIRHVTTLSALALRGYDATFRIGGEEFAVLISGDGLFETRQIGERLRELIARTPLLIEGRQIALTVSIGVAASASADQSWDAPLRRADQALYYAKKTGRNRLTVYGEDLGSSHGAQLCPA